MFKQKKFILSLLLVCVLSMPFLAKAITIDELKAQIAVLLSRVADLQKQIATLQSGTNAWCHTFNTNLGIGSKGELFGDIHALNYILYKEGLKETCSIAWDGIDQECGVTGFNEQTASAIVGFQEKYANEILTPLGLKHGTGYVGNATRAKLNKLYGCNAGGHYFCPGEGENPAVCTGSSGVCIGAKQDECCAGLTKVPDSSLLSDGTCSLPFRGEATVCTYCGNGVCSKGENTCNCPSDCKTTAKTPSGNIILEQPQSGQTITLPITIKGQSSTFEGNVPFTIKETSGRVLISSCTMGGSMGFGPFEKKLEYLFAGPANASENVTLTITEEDMSGRTAGQTILLPLKLTLPESQTIKLFFRKQLSAFNSCEVYPIELVIPKTEGIARKSLELLASGIPCGLNLFKNEYAYIVNSVNYGTKINSISIDSQGVARVDFDAKLLEKIGYFGNDTCEKSAIRAQITQTLLQFSTIKSVIISVDGNMNVL